MNRYQKKMTKITKRHMKGMIDLSEYFKFPIHITFQKSRKELRKILKNFGRKA